MVTGGLLVSEGASFALSGSEEGGTAGLDGALTGALVVQARLDLRGVPLVVQFEQTIQDLLPDHRADRVPGALARVVEPVVQSRHEQVVSPVRPDDSFVDGPVNLPQFGNIRIDAALVVHEVVGRGQPGLPGQHQLAPEGVKPASEFPHL